MDVLFPLRLANSLHAIVQSPLEKTRPGHQFDVTEVVLYSMALSFSFEGARLSYGNFNNDTDDIGRGFEGIPILTSVPLSYSNA